MTTPHSIYDLTDEWLTLMRALEDTLDEESGEYVAPEGLDAAFEALGEDINAKLAGCGHVRRRLKADAAAIKAEEARLRARRGRIDAGRERLEERVRQLMVTAGMDSAKTASITVTLAAAPMRARVFDPSSLPSSFWTRPVMPKPEPVMAVIARALKAGDTVTGAELVEGKRSLRVTT